MINENFLKILKRIAIIFLIVVFSIAGIVACSGEDITGSGGRSNNFIEMPDTNNGPTNLDPEQPDTPQQNFPDNTYYELYAPFVTTVTNYLKVSYLDTNTLNDFWKKHVTRAASNDNLRWVIRDGDNRQSDPRNGNYYYFGKNSDIFYLHETRNEYTASGYKIKVKEFVGGVIVKYNRDYKGNVPGVWTIGGLYKTSLNKERNNSQGKKGYAKYNNGNLNEFMRASDNREEGDLSVILMNVGYASSDKRYTFDFNYEFGVDEYYCAIDNNYRKNPSYFLGKNPTNYLGTDEKGYQNEKLNVRVNHSGNLKKFNFRFTMAEAYDWWLQ